MKISSSRLESSTRSRLNSQPRSGTRCSTGVRSFDDLLLADEDAADDRRRAVVDLHLGVGALRVDRRNAVDLTAEVGRRVLDRDLHDHGVGRGDLRRHLQHQHGVLERHGDGVVGDRLNRNLDALRDLRLDVVLRGQPRRREDAALAGPLERRERDVEVEGAVDGAEREPDRGRRVRRRRGSRRCSACSFAPRADVGRTLRAPRRPPIVPWLGNASGVVLPMSGIDAAVEAPLDADGPREVARRLDDARFDFDLRLGPIDASRAAPAAVSSRPAGR